MAARLVVTRSATLIECGVQAMWDIGDIRNGLNEAIKVIAGELQVKPGAQEGIAARLQEQHGR